MMKRYAGTYDEKMIMKSMKDQAIDKLDFLKEYIKFNTKSISHDEIVELVDKIERDIRNFKIR